MPLFRPICSSLMVFALLMQGPLAVAATHSLDESNAAPYPMANPAYAQAGGGTFAAPQDDPTAQRCDALADSPDDPERVGDGVDTDSISVSEALPVCEQAATRQPLRPRYEYAYGRVLMAANRDSEAVKQFSLATQAGYPSAVADLGMLYAMGIGVEKNPKQAETLFRWAANAGLPVASFDMGVFYSNGDAVEADYTEAAKWYKAAGDGGYADGYAELGTLYITGDPQNYATAAAWLQKAEQAGSIDGSLWLGWLYARGKGVQQNLPLALRLYTYAANGGSTEAAYRVGMMYRYGEGVQQDASAAAQWFYKAGKEGYTQAEAELGYMFYTGEGTRKSDTAALAWFVPAAQAGSPLAEDGVGTLCEFGEGVEHDVAKAVAWYRKAADQNDVFGMYQMGLHLRQGSGIEWNEGAAMQWFKKAADQGYAPAESALGYGYMHGLGGGTQDYGQAAYWFTRAVQHGDSPALLDLGMLYDNGWGVTQDERQAKSLYLRAANDPNPNVAEIGKKMVSLMPADTASSDSSSGSFPRSPQRSDTSWVGPAIAVVGGIVLLSALFGGHSSNAAESTPTSSAGGFPTGNTDAGMGMGGSSAPSAPPPPVCHQTPVELGFSTLNGPCVTSPTNCGFSGATTLVCN
jgi:TPR repeat protein